MTEPDAAATAKQDQFKAAYRDMFNDLLTQAALHLDDTNDFDNLLDRNYTLVYNLWEERCTTDKPISVLATAAYAITRAAELALLGGRLTHENRLLKEEVAELKAKLAAQQQPQR